MVDTVRIGAFLQTVCNASADDILVESVASEMRAKLKLKRSNGRGGWHTPSCTNEQLKAMMIEHIDKGDMIDVINFAAMIHVRSKVYGESA